MFSVIHQEKTSLRDGQGGTVFRRLYLCDSDVDVAILPVTDAPGSTAVIAAGGGCRILDHARTWQSVDRLPFFGGGGIWSV